MIALPTPEPDPATSLGYLNLASQYYVAARHAAFCQSIPVAANLAHHAVEMLLFAELARHYTNKALKTKYHKHYLPTIWNDTKQLLSINPPTNFDKFIDELKDWESIRFPNFPGNRSNSLTISIKRSSPAISSPGSPPANVYAYGLEDLDNFMAFLIPNIMTVQWFKSMLSFGADSMATYERDNSHNLW